MFLFAFQPEAESFVVKTGKFPGGLHPFGNAFGQGGTLASGDARAMKLCDGIPLDVALRIK